MTKIIELLDGKKSYLIAFVWAIAVFLQMSGFITEDLLNQIEKVLLPAGLATLRAAISKPKPVVVTGVDK